MGVQEIRERNAKLAAAGQLPAVVSLRQSHPTRIALDVCRHLGERLPGQPCGSPLLRCKLHNAITTRFTRCDKADRHCGTCADFSPLPSGKVTVPQPPALNLIPTRARAVVTVAVGPEAKACLAASGAHMRAYAQRVGADFVVLDWPGHSAWPLSSKFALRRMFDHYERIAYVDADVLLRPGCVNLFEQCAADEFGIADELSWQRGTPAFHREAKYQTFRAVHGFRKLDSLPWYLNTGVMVIPRRYAGVLDVPAFPLPIDHFSEQDLWGARLTDAALSGSLKLRLLDRRANWQNWTDPGFPAAPPDVVLHWSGAGKDRIARGQQMQKWATRHPIPSATPFDPPHATHEWEMDRWHLTMLSDVLLAGGFKHVLEIGSFRGHSTRAFLHALQAGAVGEVHLCEPHPTPELETLIAGTKVVLHRCSSAELLARDAAWDCVLLDGDHRLQTVAEEVRRLIAGGVRRIVAHDVSADPANPDCNGPPILAQALLAAGYRCEVDASSRPGERTERGLLIARK